jgi:hypothetical protein
LTSHHVNLNVLHRPIVVTKAATATLAYMHPSGRPQGGVNDSWDARGDEVEGVAPLMVWKGKDVYVPLVPTCAGQTDASRVHKRLSVPSQLESQDY